MRWILIRISSRISTSVSSHRTEETTPGILCRGGFSARRGTLKLAIDSMLECAIEMDQIGMSMAEGDVLRVE